MEHIHTAAEQMERYIGEVPCKSPPSNTKLAELMCPTATPRGFTEFNWGYDVVEEMVEVMKNPRRGFSFRRDSS